MNGTCHSISINMFAWADVIVRQKCCEILSIGLNYKLSSDIDFLTYYKILGVTVNCFVNNYFVKFDLSCYSKFLCF